MSKRISWAIEQAFYSTLTFSIIGWVLGVSLMFAGDAAGYKFGLIALAVPVLPFLVRVQNYCDMYHIANIKSPRHDFELQIGHLDEFKKRFHIWSVGSRLMITHLERKPEGIGEIHATLLSNGMLVVAMHQRHLDLRHIVLREGWPFYPLVANCKAEQLIMTWSQPNEFMIAEIKTEHVMQ